MKDPIVQFQKWFEQAAAAKLPHANAMVLATATRDGRPSARVVLYKGMSDGGRGKGFLFFTNYESQKGFELDENPRASLVMFWPTLERQIRIDGSVEKLTRPESEAYFETRPRGSQIGAWASPQSSVIAGPKFLEKKAAAARARFRGKKVPCPPFWGGFRVLPQRLEFWQGRAHRLHERVVYVAKAGGWETLRVAP